MWFIELEDGALSHKANEPNQNILPTLKKEAPGARFYRSKQSIHNEFGAAMYVKKWVQTGEKTNVQILEDGQEIIQTEAIFKCTREENQYKLAGDFIVVFDNAGNEIANFEIEQIND